MSIETPESLAQHAGFASGEAFTKQRLAALLQAARDLHTYHAAQRQILRAAGESVACPCAICVAVDRMEGR